MRKEAEINMEKVLILVHMFMCTSACESNFWMTHAYSRTRIPTQMTQDHSRAENKVKSLMDENDRLSTEQSQVFSIQQHGSDQPRHISLLSSCFMPCDMIIVHLSARILNRE